MLAIYRGYYQGRILDTAYLNLTHPGFPTCSSLCSCQKSSIKQDRDLVQGGNETFPRKYGHQVWRTIALGAHWSYEVWVDAYCLYVFNVLLPQPQEPFSRTLHKAYVKALSLTIISRHLLKILLSLLDSNKTFKRSYLLRNSSQL